MSICNIVLVGWGGGESCSLIIVSLLQQRHCSSSGLASTGFRSWSCQFSTVHKYEVFLLWRNVYWLLWEVLSWTLETSLFVVLFWCFETNKTVRMSVLLSLCGSVIMSLHWRKVSSGWFTVLDLRFIYRTAAHSPQLDWIGQQSIRYLESTGSNLRYPPLPTLVWVWWGCILRLEVFTWGRCDKAHWSSLGLFWMGSLWQLWTMQFTAWLKPHDSGVWRENNRLK